MAALAIAVKAAIFAHRRYMPNPTAPKSPGAASA